MLPPKKYVNIQLTWFLRKCQKFWFIHHQLTLTLGQILNASASLQASRICPAGIGFGYVFL
jgi:hypothetical protein